MQLWIILSLQMYDKMVILPFIRIPPKQMREEWNEKEVAKQVINHFLYIHNKNYLPMQLCIFLIKRICKQNLQIKEESTFKL